MCGVLFFNPILPEAATVRFFLATDPIRQDLCKRSTMSRMPYFILLVLAISFSDQALAQQVSGMFERPLPARMVVLYGTTGSEHPPLDSTAIQPDGRFTFGKTFEAPGFYQLGVNDSDRVDIILDPLEPAVEMAFHGIPLQRNLSVITSGENQRLWTYKGLSRQAQERASAIQQERLGASPLDTGLIRRLDREESALRVSLRNDLDSLAMLAPNGQFAFGVAVDHRLDAAIPLGRDSIREAFDFADPRTLRSAAFSKAVVTYLQSTAVEYEFSLHDACDSLLQFAERNAACWTYMRHHLVDIFATYGPDDLAQYLVDRYVVGAGSLHPPDPTLLEIAAAQMRMAIGAPAPDIELVRPGIKDTTMLSDVWPKHDHTAIFFYSSTCDHCHEQMPGLRQVVADELPEHFQLIGIALDATEEEFFATIAEESITWPSYTRLMGWGDQGAKDFNVKATPTIFVLDRQGRIAAKPRDHDELRAFLDKN